jgi:hypothetical protein
MSNAARLPTYYWLGFFPFLAAPDVGRFMPLQARSEQPPMAPFPSIFDASAFDVKIDAGSDEVRTIKPIATRAVIINFISPSSKMNAYKIIDLARLSRGRNEGTQ